MMPEQPHLTRRSLVRALLLAGSMTPALMSVLRSPRAMSRKPITPGVQEFTGDFRLNGVPARRGQIVNPGDIATTRPGASAIIVIGQHAFMLRESTTIEFFPVYFEDDGKISGIINVAAGAMLSVFGETGKTTIATPVALIGIRGTGCYVESRPERTYACVCYGRAELSSAPTGRLLETVTTTRHDQPRFIYPPGAPTPITTAPVIDHGDAELRLLEALVYRTPPFDEGGEPGDDRY
jgi:hypothetical protein